MFNIRNSIYVSHPGDVSMLSNQQRVISLIPGYEPIDNNGKASSTNPQEKGIVFQYNSYLEMIALEFAGSDRAFYTWLMHETNLYITVARDDDYARLFVMMLLEIKQEFGVSDEHIQELLNLQRLKDFFTGRPNKYDLSDAFKLLSNGTYKPLGRLVEHAQDLPLEYALYLYYHKYITKDVVNLKVANISRSMLLGLIGSVTTNIRNDLVFERKVLQEFLGVDSINSISEAITAIRGNLLLNTLFFNTNALDLNDETTYERIKEWTRLCVTYDVDYPEEHPRQLYEHDVFYTLFETNDVDVIINNIIPFSQHDFIGNKGQKFNTLLLTSLYAETAEQTGNFNIVKIDSKWSWQLFDNASENIGVSKTFTTKKATLANIDAIKSISQFATITDTYKT